VCVCVCVCVCGWVRACVCEMAKLRSCKKCHDSPGTLSFLMPKSWQNSNWVILNGDAKCRWGRLKSATFNKEFAMTLGGSGHQTPFMLILQCLHHKNTVWKLVSNYQLHCACSYVTSYMLEQTDVKANSQSNEMSKFGTPMAIRPWILLILGIYNLITGYDHIYNSRGLWQHE